MIILYFARFILPLHLILKQYYEYIRTQRTGNYKAKQP
jgi:hypothetical protein